ncbi:molybdopterin-dependent oxidoreductase [Elioraea sp. Yellowstone]|jgi:anaerobic selenocysteine-containing dehydrogenase|uniref:molybdopterin oxidoreductase family protein n=1 Tax=Elioraea sp. Yellowstone TaxID=2592070 RepID=UPI00114EDB08|nr:molybdopterin oxidoreductase family protein [Elioraea sp. Yellowstone]TQF78874.1 molybdopterin-dependent oxidoreductase [Elioraea sp. Yellowstone]
MERLDPSPPVSDEVKHTTCYMCACRCGIRVHLRNGQVRYIEGNPDHPVNRGVLCAKGSAGIMNHYSPARLRKPLKRVGERGSGEFVEIAWDEALAIAESWLREAREKDPRRLAFYTGRDQSQGLTGWWAQMYGTPNYAAHGGFCSVNMAAAGLYTLGGSFWEFGEPDFERTKLFLMFGVAEDHDSNPIKLGLAELKRRGATFISVNPVRTGYSAIADRWVPIRPGTDGALVLALVHELLKARRVDLDFLADYTNAGWLVIDDPRGPDDGLFARDEAGTPLVLDRGGAPRPWNGEGVRPLLARPATLADGRRAKPVFLLLAERYLDERYSADAAAAITGVPAEEIRGLAAELARVAFDERIEIDQVWTDWRGVTHDRFVGRPVSLHAMRGISAHANGFQTCRALHLLQLLLGAIDTPGAWRYKSPYPRPAPPPIRPGGKPGELGPGKPMPRPPLGFPMGPEDLLVEADGRPVRLDQGYSWEAPIAAHGLMHLVIRNAWAGEPYPIDVLFLYMANMAWNSAMNAAGTVAMLTDKHADGSYKIPRIIYSDAFFSETVPYADLVLPDTTYLERYDCISLLDRPIGKAEGPGDAIRHPVVPPDRDVRPFQDVLLELGARLGLPGMVTEDGSPRYPGGYADYIVNHERAPGIGPLAGWRGPDGALHGKGPPNPRQLERYIAHGGFWHYELPSEALFFKFANKAYLDHAVAFGLIAKAEPIVLQLYVEPLQRFRLAARGHGPIQPPEHLRERVATHCDPLPAWHPPFEGQMVSEAAFPLHAVTQRPAAMYHSWGSQNAWLRQIHGENRLYMNRGTAAALGIADDDWVHVTSHHGRITVQVRLMEGVEPHTVWTWNAIGKRAGAWNLDPRAREATHGFLLNHLISELLPDGRLPNADPITGQAAWYDLRVRVEKAAVAPEAVEPALPPLARPPGLADPPRLLRYGAQFGRSPERRRVTAA